MEKKPWDLDEETRVKTIETLKKVVERYRKARQTRKENEEENEADQ